MEAMEAMEAMKKTMNLDSCFSNYFPTNSDRTF